MLPAKRRIKRPEFSQIIKIGKRLHSPHFMVYIVKTGSDAPSRFSFSISKKIAPSAVTRNMYRRRGYAVIERHLQDISYGYLCFFLYKKGEYPVIYAELEQEIITILDKLE